METASYRWQVLLDVLLSNSRKLPNNLKFLKQAGGPGLSVTFPRCPAPKAFFSMTVRFYMENPNLTHHSTSLEKHFLYPASTSASV